MKFLIGMLVVLCAALCGAQEGFAPPPPPAELKQVAFLLGNWEGKETYTFGEMKSEGTGNHHIQMALRGRFLESHYKAKSGFMGDSEGRLLLTYDTAAKKFRSWWYDSSDSGNMEMEGNVEGDSLVMISKPTSIPGMGVETFRATFTKKGDNQLTFVLALKAGDKWEPMIEASYTKK